MNVLHVSPYFAPAFRYGGPVESVLGLCRALKAGGVGVEVLTTTADGAGEVPFEIVRRGEFGGIPVRYLGLRFPRRYFNAVGLADTLRATLPNVDVVHVHGIWSFPAWLAARESQRARVPFVVSPRGMLDAGSMAGRRLKKTIGYWLRERRYLRHASLLHATSVAEEENLDRLQLGPPIVRLPNGVAAPASPERGFRKRHGIAAAADLVLYLGRLHPIKRLDLIVGAFARVKSVRPRARLVLAGPEDGLDASALIRDGGGPDAVSWVGAISGDDKWSLLSEADVLTLCSDSESFGMSVVEAMAVGTPVVTTTTCPWREVETAGAGFWVPQRQPDIADALVRVLEDRVIARAMGERGKDLVAERYRWSAIGRAMSSQYERIRP